MNSLNGLEQEKGENRSKNFRRSGTLIILFFIWQNVQLRLCLISVWDSKF